MTDLVIVTVSGPDRDTELRTEIAYLDSEIDEKRCELLEKLCELERLQKELHDLEVKQANLLDELGSEED